jgi:Rod binding domain-containing protein
MNMMQPIAISATRNASVDESTVEKIRKTSLEFEQLLVQQMLREIRGTGLSSASSGASTFYWQMVDEGMAKNIVDAGGLGFGRAMADQMLAQIQARQLIEKPTSAVNPSN